MCAFAVSACTSQPVTSNPATPTIASAPQPTIPLTPEIASPLVPTAVLPSNFDGKHAYDEYLIAQMNFGLRPAGSRALRATGDYIIAELKKTGWDIEIQEFNFRGIPIRNVIAKTGAGQGPLLILGAHYDTRPRANMDPQDKSAGVPGANDGASGVSVLLELARTIDKSKLKNELWLAFFDAEDNGDLSACDLRIVTMQVDTPSCDTTTWTWSVGATHVAENLPTTPEAVVVVDMIGDANQDIHYEHNSDKTLQEQLWGIANTLGYSQWFIPEYRWTMTDDHTPFIQKGITAVDLIDFDYPPWHTRADTADKVSADALERVGRVLKTWLETK